MSDDCIFRKIAQKEISSDFIYEDETVVVFKDLEPQAPVHVLVIPKKHITSLMAVEVDDKELVAHITCEVIPKLARKLGIDETGFRVVVNTGCDGGQTVKHLHFHLLGGRSMIWPPG
ncbi:MAG: histidine triad nucleotide-binding protein [Selenomonadaceae bacterium]